MSDEFSLPMFVIYNRPMDYPTKFVVRRHTVLRDGIVADPSPHFIGDDLESARESLPPGLYNIGRQPQDVLSIVEVWT